MGDYELGFSFQRSNKFSLHSLLQIFNFELKME